MTLTALQQTLTPGIEIANLRANYLDSVFWDGGASPPGGTNAITVNFGQPRSVKTIRLTHFPGCEINAGVVATSPDGVTWTTQPHTFIPSGAQRELALQSAVTTQYLRLTATDIADDGGTNRWVVTSLRVFGETGALVDRGNTLDVIANGGGGVAGDATLALKDTAITDTTPAEFLTDALNPIKRSVLYQLGTGSAVTLEFARAVTMKKLGLFHAPSPAGDDPDAHLTVETSRDGTTYTRVLSSASFPLYLNYYALTPSTARFLRLIVTQSTVTDNRISDIQLFGVGTTE